MRRLRWITFCLLAIGTLTPRAFADVSAEERQQAFAWFDSLGYPAVKSLSFVKVYTGDQRYETMTKNVPAYDYGFLTQSDAKQFSVCRLTLETKTFTIVSSWALPPLDCSPLNQEILLTSDTV